MAEFAGPGRVRVRMRPGNSGLIGEDGQDWMGGEVHEASLGFAAFLVQLELASYEGSPTVLEASVEESATRDPQVKRRR